MSEIFLLDTNAYFLLFQNPKNDSYYNLIEKIKTGEKISFFISEMTSLEIHSVLGKYRRISPSSPMSCDRKIVSADDPMTCQNTWIPPQKKRIKPRVFRDLRKYILDIESCKGPVCAEILAVSKTSLSKGKRFLMKYSDRYSISSHDAVIMGTLLETREKEGIPLTMVTSDKSLKASLREEGMPVYDPFKDS